MRTLKTQDRTRSERSGPALPTGQAVAAGSPAAQAGGKRLERMPGEQSVIQAQQVSFSYAGGSKLILDSLDLDVKKGEIVVFIGPSGCGKSTVLGLIAGVLQPTSGTLVCN